MSAKTRRLKNRLRIEREQAEKDRKGLRREMLERERRLLRWENRLRDEQRDLDRSAALRIRVHRDFMQPSGPAFALTIVVYPNEYRITMGRQQSFRDVTYEAAGHGNDAGRKVAEVIERCLRGELEEFMRAK